MPIYYEKQGSIVWTAGNGDPMHEVCIPRMGDTRRSRNQNNGKKMNKNYGRKEGGLYKGKHFKLG